MDSSQPAIKPYTPDESGFWRVTLALMLASLLVFSTLYVFQPLLPIFVNEFQVSATESSFLMSAAVIAMVVGLFILGFAADRYGRLRLMQLSLGVTVLLLAAMPFTSSFEWLVVLRLLQGFFLAGIPAAAMGYLGEEVDPNHLGLAMTLYISSNALGGMGGRVAGGYLTDVFDWEKTLFILSAFGVAAALLFLLLLPSERYFTKGDQPLREDFRGMLVHLKDRYMLVLFLMGLLLQIVFTAIWTYIPFHLQSDPYQWPLKWISFTYFAYVLGVLAPPLAGRLSNHFGLTKVMFSGLFILIAGAGFTALQPVSWIMAGLGVLCSGFFIAHSMAAALVSKSANHHRSGASSFYLISYYVGVAVGSTAVGTLWEKWGWSGVISTVLVFILIFISLPVFKRKSGGGEV
ncbi:MFS transporter [Halobacillus sp. B29]|uniref:MFS transporter n=1 Tax=Halobacillus sp. B29 TaxID=3457432 RepID=UPI003FCC63C9